MANKGNNKFDIPTGLILLAFIIYWPIGIVLAILKAISSASSNSSSSKGHWSAEQERSKFEAARQEELNRQKNDAMLSELEKMRQRQQFSRPGQVSGKEPVGTNPYYEEQTRKNEGKKAQQSDGYKGLLTGGIIFAVISGFMLLFSGLAFSSGAVLSFLGALSLPILISAAFFIGAGILKKRDMDLSRMKKMIGTKESYNLSKLASASGKSLKKVRKQLQKMIDKGEFGDNAYIDLGTNNFMRNPDAEPDNPDGFDYRTVYGDLFDRKNEADKQKEGAEEVQEDDSDEARFAKILSEIRRLNGEIRDDKVSERIDRIEIHTRHIFDYVTEHPDMMPQIRTFMNYYLPTTLKLLESYSRIERVGVAGENMKKSKENIESILDLLVVGFEQQVDQLFRNESIDITADISVLETMMQKDGLNGKSDFDITSHIGEAKPEPREKKKDPKITAAAEEEEDFTDGWTDEIGDGLGGGAAAKKKENR